MTELTYQRMTRETDADIPLLKQIHDLPEVSRYVSISDGYFSYVTNTPAVHYYKAYDKGELIGAVHLEKQGTTLYMSVVVFPAFQGKGMGRRMVRDVQEDLFALAFDRIEVSIDERNEASRRLFESAGFVFMDRDGELMNYVFVSAKGG